MPNSYINSFCRSLILGGFFLFLFSSKSLAQTPVFTESFGETAPGICDQGTLADGFLTIVGTWTVTSIGVNDSAANEWYISATEPGLPSGSCPVPGCDVNNSMRNRTLHIGNVPNSPNAGFICPTGDCGAVYDPGGFQQAVQTNKRAESPSFLMQANTSYYLTFDYIEFADNLVGSDNMLIEFFDGSTWVTIAGGDAPRTTTSCGSSYQWERYTVPLPVVSTNTNGRIGFRWFNDNGGVGSNPSIAIDSIIVVPISAPVASILTNDTTICVNDCIDFRADSAGAGASYTWSFNGAATPTSSLQNPTGICFLSPGTYSVYLQATSLGGSDLDSITITVDPCAPPTAEFFASDSVFCERDCILFTDQSTDGPTAWSWSFPGGVPSTSSAPIPPPICYNTPGFYDVTLIVSNQFGSDTLTKTAYLKADSCPLPIANFTSVPVQFCPEHCVSFSDASQYGPILSYQWYFPGGTPDTSSSPTPAVCYDQEGFYDVQLIVTNQYGSDTIVKYSEVSASFNPNVFASPDTTMEFGESYQLNAGGGVAYQWAPSTGLSDTAGGSNPTVIPNPVASPVNTTTYTVAIRDSAGCTAYRQVTVTILHDNIIFIPTAFSPNGDGFNDILYVRANNVYSMRLTIFDRWGEQLFETTDQSVGWNGTYKDKELGPGVYTYVVTVNFDNKDSVTKSGTVTLVR